MRINEYLKDKILISDGAMGTYYSEISGNDISYCEFANLNDKNTIKKIHSEYINAGSKLIRTNTFSANIYDLGVTHKILREIIYSGIEIAKEAVSKNEVFIGASIGPIRKEDNLNEFDEEILEEYKFIIDCFLENNIDIFIFETFSSYTYLKEISEYIKNKNEKAFISTSFAIKPDGFTRDGFSVGKILKYIEKIDEIDGYGFNCGSGPSHLSEILRKVEIRKEKIISVLPNAGFPEMIHERTVYPNNPLYFAKRVSKLKNFGVSILGGCCGTNPSYIKKLSSLISINKIDEKIDTNIVVNNNKKADIRKNSFKEKLNDEKFVIAIELSPPLDNDIYKLIEGAKLCKENNIDLVTIPDSPMSRVRADSVIIASKIQREIGIDSMPHICCRDKNTNAIRSSLIGGHIENIRNILAITGDSISDASKVETKSVFNLNSFKLIELINDMNSEVFKEDGFLIAGALNLNVRNKEAEFNRMMKKIEKGANLFLTQPIYDDDAIEFLKLIKQRVNVKILAGILPVVSYRNAMFLNNELPGVTIPEKYINLFSEDMTKEEGQAVGIKMAIDIVKNVKEYSDGLYLVAPFYRVSMLIDIIKEIRE